MKKISAYSLFLIFIFFNQNFSQDIVSVISPNGGESWVADSSHQITWSDNFDPQVKIELFKGGVFHSLIVNSTISNGAYTWVINKSIPSGSDYRVKISSTVNSNVFDFSDENFTIIANQVTITSPNGGEDWKAGTTQTITWTDNFNGDVWINLYKGPSLHTIIVNPTPSDGLYNWTIPFDITGGSDYSIRIASVNNSSVVFDNSDNNFTITPNQITVTSPNGGEIWRTYVPQTITWNDNLTGSVKIELYQGGQNPGDFHSLLTTSTPSNGSFLWNVTIDVKPANDYYIKITSNDNNNVFDFSDTAFTFIKEITVLSPNNGGEAWLVGSTQNIGWTDNISENVTIDLFKSDTFYTAVAFSTGSDGSYNWDISDTTKPGSDYKIKITSVDEPGVFDFSNNNFTIVGYSITVLSPDNGTEAWLVGSQQTINWTDNFPGNASIDLFKSDTFYTIIEFSTASDGSYNWVISDSTAPGSDYKIKIASVDDPGVFDFSDNYFTILPFNITVTRPNGGEQWEIGKRYDIVWTDNIPENVKIDLYKGGLFYSTIDFSTSSDGLQPWDIPLSIVPGDDYKIQITRIRPNDSTLFDLSDGDFTLFLPKITITAPNGGEIWQSGTNQIITWTDVIPEGVQIDLYKSDTLYSPISPSTPSDGAFNWNIPRETEAGSDYKIMIKSTINDIIVDFSDGNFTIKTVPDNYILSQNYPNPFNPSTTILYGIPEAGRVRLEVFDITGQKLFTLVDGEQSSGFHQVQFENSVLPSGVYFYRIIAGKFIDFKKMILTK